MWRHELEVTGLRRTTNAGGAGSHLAQSNLSSMFRMETLQTAALQEARVRGETVDRTVSGSAFTTRVSSRAAHGWSIMTSAPCSGFSRSAPCTHRLGPNHGIHAFLALVTVLLCSSYARSQTAATPVPAPVDPLLTALIGEALEKNPDVVAAQEAVSAARARPAQARSLSNPMVSSVYTNDGVSPSLGTQEMTTLAFMWGQDLPYPGKRRLRGDILAHEADQVEQQLERARLSIAAAVKRAYYALILARDLLDLIGEQEEVWKQVEGVARARYTVGQGVQQDIVRAQIEITRIEQLRIIQSVEVEVRVAELNRLLDRPAASPLETSAHVVLRPVEGSLDEFLSRLRSSSPEVGSTTIGVEKSRLGVALARKEFKPDFTAQGGYMNRGGLDPMWQAGVGLSLPIYGNRLRGRLAEAEAQLRASQSLAQSVGLQLRFRTQERLSQLLATEKTAALYADGVIPQDRLSFESALANYQTGRLPFIAVLEALTTLYSDRAAHLEVLTNHERILASLEEASLEETSGMSGAGSAGMSGVAGTSLRMTGGSAGMATSAASGSMGNP